MVLPQPLTDDALKDKVTSLFRNIADHVENFYHSQPFDDAMSKSYHEYRQTDLPRGLLGQDGIAFDELLGNPATRPSAIQSLVCAELLDSINVFSRRDKSLLPPAVTSFLTSVALPPDMPRG